jgi:hypothetical protein
MGLYNLDSKYPSSGYGGGASTGSFNQKVNQPDKTQ